MENMLILSELLDYINKNTLIGVKGGMNDHSFLDIWIVSVEQRIFARSWRMSERSWFTEFCKKGVGQLKFGDKILDVKGNIMNEQEMNNLISTAYREKYTQKENIYYVKSITEPIYNNFTMEFIIL